MRSPPSTACAGPSMGPRSFERGDLARLQKLGRKVLTLQWGRALSSAETPDRAQAQWSDLRSFNGAALFRARRPQAGNSSRCSNPSLQWGRALSSAETQVDLFTTTDLVIPSMGPRSFERGDLTDSWFRGAYKIPSMGPRSFERGDVTPPRCHIYAAESFNGAALFRARRPAMQNLTAALTMPFNGAALFRARRLGHNSKGVHPGPSTFNGAALFRARRPHQRQMPLQPSTALQWGRALSSAETGRLAVHTSSSSGLQWGRALSSAETPEIRREV